MLTKDLISKSDAQYLQDDLSRWIAKRKVLSTYYQSQKNNIQHQLTELNDTVDILKNFLLKLQESERNLVVRAPISGNLVGFDIELGQQILPKEEFGSLDIIDNFLIEVELSEFYLDRVNESMQVLASFDNRNVELNVLKIFPKVKQGQFRMHLEVRLLESVARNIKVGQSIEIELTNATETLQASVPVNATFKENSNVFVYLLSKNQSKAVKTPISIKNTIGNVLLVDNMDLLGKTLIVLDWDKNYEEELYIE
ncbi:HlyD family efflux transporter periplasmic adaptor subunit [Vibrio splendidus]